MSKRKANLSYEEKLKEGRGSGEFENYKPWLTVQDFPSIGRVSRKDGMKSHRRHHFLSDLEGHYFYYLDFEEDIIDIREQYPLLPLEQTLLIAEELGIEHPKHPTTKEPIVMTTDYFIVQQVDDEVVNKARTIKYKKDLLDDRVIEKFEIEREFFKRQSIDWGIVTEEEISKKVAITIEDLYDYIDFKDSDIYTYLDNDFLDDLKLSFISQSADYIGSMRKLCTDFDKIFHVDSGTGIAIFKHLIINRIIRVDILNGIDLRKHINIELNREHSFLRGLA